MESTTLKTIPGPGILEAVRGLRQHGFLDYIGQLWQTYGDTFQLNLGLRTLIFAMNPESVRYINITNRKNYDKLDSYDGVRRYLIGEVLVASTGDLWRRQRKLMSPFFTHRHPDFWENPQKFDPDRWTPEREAARHAYAYHPFVVGQRICIGNNFSLLESHILLALLAKRFDPQLAAGFTPQRIMRGVLATANGMPIRIEAR